MKTNVLRAKAIAAAVLLPLANGFAGNPMPEFGRSVEFDAASPQPSLPRLKGKAVLVIFFQSWCGICNGWSPDLIKAVESQHGLNRSLVLIAIKTDGGGVAGARNYLKSAGADQNMWLIGADRGAEFYRQVTGNNELWGYVLVGTDGNIVKNGKAGSFFAGGAERKEYVLASPGLLKGCGNPMTVLPSGKTYLPDLVAVVRFAELGYLGKALALCSSAARGSVERIAAANGLRQDILDVIQTRIETHTNLLNDSARSGGERYDALKRLDALVEEVGAVPATQEVRALVAKCAKEPALVREAAAEAAYNAVADKLGRASPRDKPRVLREMANIAEKFAGTKFGDCAAEASRGSAASQKRPKTGKRTDDK